MESRLKELNRYLMGWIGYFRLASAQTHCERLDEWMCLWKQRKLPKSRLRNLRALGVPEWAARMMANSRRGCWEMSRNIINALNRS
ncbi:group II intron maturase-specific domain-containing protein [Cohnella endophytica]|uniref:group II intron maturase-specific domain-containing protein n=1 Tax=Cohnella endophytica TaxID=2419778 RepID=UPI001F2863B7|nr:group II intron maturase-specific domain-containing protein [Cohnella endophytica]